MPRCGAAATDEETNEERLTRIGERGLERGQGIRKKERLRTLRSAPYPPLPAGARLPPSPLTPPPMAQTPQPRPPPGAPPRRPPAAQPRGAPKP